ncbi:META domain-containing protein [Tabrizicola sp. J26]|uniref:META domain-containing protein n=1 Tax=Alitabrizicola rongguiensis TaxID=2909234 RepID=UPI001F2DC1A5|nr:META domain-containing protein [Tabrizicola rongguiensis]MCF1708893.1 META domain-containing protein [Tabrizicola rongguiensis]
MRRLTCLILATVLAAAPALARDVTGEVGYRERIALPEDAQLVVELRGPAGIVAEARIQTKGAQVPLRFAVVAPDNGDYSLRGAIFVAGRADWVSAQVPVAAGEGPVDLGLVPLTRPSPVAFNDRMICGNVPIQIDFLDGGARLKAGDEAIRLEPLLSADGARYGDNATPPTEFWGKGNFARVTLKGTELPECEMMIPDPILPITLRGNEPFWRLDLSETGYTFQPTPDAAPISGGLPEPYASADGLRMDLATGLVLTLSRTICSDTMSGMPFPVTAKLEHDGRTLSGCGGRPEDLLAGAWQVTQIGARAIPAEVELSIVFDVAEGRVYGKSACNRYNAAFTLTGEGLSFGPAAATMMACPDELMALEQEFQSLLATVSGFDVSEAGTLDLRSGDSSVMLAARP